MQATDTKPQRRERFALILDESRFRPLIKAHRGDLPDYKLGELFKLDDSVWSLVKCGKRYIPNHMLAILTHELLPAVPVIAYTNRVLFKPRSER